MRDIIRSVEAEYTRYKALAEGAMAQLEDADVNERGPNAGNSIAMIVWHVSGNLASRFTDFLTSDGEKPWRTIGRPLGRVTPQEYSSTHGSLRDTRTRTLDRRCESWVTSRPTVLSTSSGRRP